jgi:hypothetical protein
MLAPEAARPGIAYAIHGPLNAQCLLADCAEDNASKLSTTRVESTDSDPLGGQTNTKRTQPYTNDTQAVHFGDFDPSGLDAGEKIEQTWRVLALNTENHFERRKYQVLLAVEQGKRQAIAAFVRESAP